MIDAVTEESLFYSTCLSVVEDLELCDLVLDVLSWCGGESMSVDVAAV